MWGADKGARCRCQVCNRASRAVLLLRYTVGCALLLATVGCAKPPAAYLPGTGTLVVTLDGLRNDRGTAIVSVFAGPAGFPDQVNAAVRNAYLPIAEGRAVAIFTDLPYGEYAVSVLHDEDGDGRMATGLFGTPREGFGFSGAPDLRFGQPDFAAASIVLVAPQRELSIGMHYETGRRRHQDEGRAGNLGRPQE